MKKIFFLLLITLSIQLQKSFSQNTVKLDTVEGYLYSFYYNLGMSLIDFYSPYNYTSTLMQKLEKWPKGYPTHAFVIEQFVSDSIYYLGKKYPIPEIKYQQPLKNSIGRTCPQPPYDAITVFKVQQVVVYSENKHFEITPNLKCFFKEMRVVENTYEKIECLALIIPCFSEKWVRTPSEPTYFIETTPSEPLPQKPSVPIKKKRTSLKNRIILFFLEE